jgi:drug/metabolite transporter (DMT)-like permease
VNPSEPEIEHSVARGNPSLLGAAFCASSALLYALTNICLRWLAIDADPMWSICVKETVSTVIVGPLLVHYALRGVRLMPNRALLGRILLVGVATQLAGNVPVLWSLGVVGLAITIPVVVGVTLVASALLGHVLLGERVDRRSALALGLLIVAVVLLSLGAGQTNQSVAGQTGARVGPLWVLLGVAAACLAGSVFALLSITIRSSMTAGVQPSVVVVLITGMGLVCLGPLSLWHLGPQGILATRPADLQIMLLAGLLNLAAFASITKGLQLTTIVHANVLSASQTALAAIAGMVIFHEPPNSAMLLGVTCTVVGIMLIDHTGPRDV